MIRIVLLLVVVLSPWWASVIAHRLELRLSFAGLLGAPERRATIDDYTPPQGWDERRYLAEYPDVAAAVRAGTLISGYEHFKAAGEKEGRRSFLTAAAQRNAAKQAEPAAAPAPPVPETAPQAAPPPPAPETTIAAAPPPLPTAPPPSAAAPKLVPTPPKAPVRPPPPQPASGTYVVREGGALARVAEVTGISVDELRAANPAPLPGWLPPGTTLQIPVREAAPSPAAPPIQTAQAPPAPPVQTPPVPPPPAAVATPTPRPPPLPPTPPERPPAVREAAAPAPPSPPPAAAQPAGSKVNGIRFGQHTDSVRVVLDTSQAVRFQPVLQPDGRTIHIDLPDAAWAAALSAEFDRAFLLQSYRAAPRGGGGSRLVLVARKPVAVKHSAAFTPSGSFGHRVVLDLAAR